MQLKQIIKTNHFRCENYYSLRLNNSAMKRLIQYNIMSLSCWMLQNVTPIIAIAYIIIYFRRCNNVYRNTQDIGMFVMQLFCRK